MTKSKKSVHEIWLLLLFIIATVAISYVVVKFTPKKVKAVEKTLGDVSFEWEKKFKNLMIDYIREDSRILTNEELNQSITQIKERLLDKVTDNPYEVEILVVHSSMTNAFAFPGGLIVIYSPLIRSTENPQELASVMAHEMGHVINRDPVKRLIHQFGVSTVLTMLGGSGETTVFLESIIKDFVTTRYSRSQEDRADEFALKLLDSCSIDPMHFCNFLEKVHIEKKSSMHKIERHFMSHPDMESRIEKAKTYATKFNKDEKPFNIDWKRIKKLLPSVFD